LENAKRTEAWNYIKTYFPEYRDKNQHYAELLQKDLGPEKTLLDLGCGRGLETKTDYKKLCGHTIGVDPTDAVMDNPYVDEKLVGSAYELPVDDQSVDVITSQQVLEHIEFPEKLFFEANRVLKPGGKLFLMTPNLWYPTTLLSAITPYSFHLWVTKNFFEIEEFDTFPTYYKANRLSTLRRIAEKTGFEVTHEERYQCNPGQFDFNSILNKVETQMIRALIKYDSLSLFRDIVIGVYKKKD